jgi:glycogen debranching enzyme
MYMSKNWMTNIWSWDHCFNAMALVRHDPKLAWDQFMIFFDRQDESGLIPDFVNDKYELWNCNKPPIHGWTLAWMMKRTDYIREAQLREVYGPLSKWTKWWFRYRDDDGDGIPQYNHGNDSGWDNSTAFNNGIPVESPDLAAFLIIQTELLAEIAGLLGLSEESSEWRKLADNTLEKMISHFWKDGRFISLRSGTHEPSAGDSLLLFVPILLGKRLPEPIRDVLLKGLGEENRFLTENGWATESISSPYYIPDGYWRGPIWAPSTMLLVEGVAAAGDLELAQEVSRRFCNMLSRSGMAENFDALTGEGLRDRAFTWTSSVFLILGHEYTT